MHVDAKNVKALVLSFAAASVALLASTRSDAFCRTTSERPPPEHGTTSCWTEGVPLYHAGSCLPYRLLTQESSIIPNAVLSSKLAAAFSAWTAPNPRCTPDIVAIELAPVADSTIVGYRKGERGRNVVGVVPTWKYDGANDTLALSTLTFNSSTGEIYDVDLEVNGEVRWGLDTPSADQFDLQSALTHEAGHMLGFAHSTVIESTMHPTAGPGTMDKRTLHDDDEAAICAAYSNRAHAVCDLAPVGPDGACGEPVITHGCAAARRNGGDALFGCVIALGVVIARARKRGLRLR